MKLYVVANGEDLKCGGCNWKVNGNCMAELLAEKGYEIIRKEEDD